MLEASVKKIVSARSVVRFISLGITSVGIVIYLLNIDSNKCGEVEIKYKNFSYCALVADDSSERFKGLSGRSYISENEAMLFVFDDDDYHGIWMKGMLTGIDVAWLDINKEVIELKKNMQPSSYPDIFYPDIKSRYVIEFAEGSIDKYGLTVGDKLYW